MSDILGTSEWQLNEQEVGYHVGSDALSQRANSYKIYIPNILPMITQGKAAKTSEPITGACFINDAECQVSMDHMIVSANYIEVPVVDNMAFQRPVLPYGSKVMIGNRGNSVDNLYVTNFSDSSEYSKTKSVNKSYTNYLSTYLGLGGTTE